MSKYDDLRKSYTEARNQMFEYRRKCISILSGVATVLEKEWGGKDYVIRGAPQELEDGFAFMQVGIELFEAFNIQPHYHVTIDLYAKEAPDGAYLLKDGESQPVFRIDPSENFDAKASEFLEGTYQRLVQGFEHEVDDLKAAHLKGNRTGNR